MNLHTATQSFGASKKGVPTVAIIGGGPAGLTAAYELQKHSESHHPVVFEESDQVGGISRTEVYKGYRYDIGGHRFFTKVKSVEELWKEVLPNDFLAASADEPHLLPQQILRLSAEAAERAAEHGSV